MQVTLDHALLLLLAMLSTTVAHADGDGCCYEPNGTPGCSTAACCSIVCAIDPTCCDVAWDGGCVHKADTLCHARCPGDATGDDAIDVADLTAVLLAWGTDDAFSDVNRDCLVDVADLADVIVHWGHCAAGACCVAGGNCYDFTEAQCDFHNGVYFGDGSFCAENECTCAGGDCCAEGGNGTPGCDDEACCKTICVLDPFCCRARWDGICAEAAQEFCSVCAAPRPCLEPCDGSDEGEPCGSDVNGGCNSSPPIFGSIACGETVCGIAWADGGVRDTDWYLFDVTEACTTVTVRLRSEHACLAFVVAGVERCIPVIIVDPVWSDGCVQAPGSIDLGPGMYAVFVAASGFDGFPCGTPNGYELTLECTACPPD